MKNGLASLPFTRAWFRTAGCALVLLLAACLAAPVNAQTVPGVPTAFTATPGNGSLTLNWSPPASDGGSPITNYYNSCGTGLIFQTASTVYSFTISSLTNGASYDCFVYAKNARGDGALAPLRATPVGPPPPPTGLMAAPGTGTASLSWVAPSSNGGAAITGYKVTSSPGGFSCATTGTLSCTITGLANGTPYSFTATATSSLGTGAPSSAVSATTANVAGAVAGAPTGVTAALLTAVTLPAGSVRVTWVAPASSGASAITAYNVTASPGGKSCATTGALTCDLSGLSAGTSYTLSVTASNTGGISPAGSVTLLTPTVPGAPTALKATPGNGSITLNWAAPASDGGTPVTSYYFGCWYNGSHPGNVVYSGTIGSLANGTSADCKVAAYNAMGQGPYSTISATPVAPATVTATPTTTTTTTTAVINAAFAQIAAGTSFTNASIGSANNYGGIAAGQLTAWNGTAWAPGGIALSQVAYGSDGTRWGVTSTGVIYHFTTSWVTAPGGLKQISVGNASNVWGANSVGNIYKWNGTGWSSMPGTFASVSVGSDGTVFGLQANDSIWRWNGATWTQIAGGLRQISVGSASNVWGVNAGGYVYKFNPSTLGWESPAVPAGAFVGVSTAADGSTILMRNDGTLWKK